MVTATEYETAKSLLAECTGIIAYGTLAEELDRARKTVAEYEPIHLGELPSPYLADLGDSMEDSAAIPDTLKAGDNHVAARGEVVVMFGNRGSGKSWIAATWAAQELQAGNTVVWADWERQSGRLRERLSLLGVTDDEIDNGLVYLNRPDLDRLVTVYDTARGHVALVVFDAGRDLLRRVAPENKTWNGDDVSEADDMVLTPWAESGAAVCVITHESKTSARQTDDKASAIGSERWESAADSVFRVVKSEGGFSQKTDGFADLVATKSRDGSHDEFSHVARFTMKSGVPAICGPDTDMGEADRDRRRAVLRMASKLADKPSIPDGLLWNSVRAEVRSKLTGQRDELIAEARAA